MRYSAFGLGLSASHPIPRLAGTHASATVDLRIRLDQRPAWWSDGQPARPRYESPYRDSSGAPTLVLSEFENGWLRLSFADGPDFMLDRTGREVWATWPSALSLDDASSYLLGPVMGFVLRLRGTVCLHASAVAVGGGAVALLGPSGAGKSTTAAAFAAKGWPVMSDDIVPLAENHGGFVAHSGYPRLRLWPKSVEALEALSDSAPRLPANWGDRRFHLDLPGHHYAFQTEPLPLVAVYVLGERTSETATPSIDPLGGEDALMALVAQSFASSLLDRAMRAADLLALGRLVDAVPIRAVRPHTDLDRIPALVEAILNDAARPRATGALAS